MRSNSAYMIYPGYYFWANGIIRILSMEKSQVKLKPFK